VERVLDAREGRQSFTLRTLRTRTYQQCLLIGCTPSTSVPHRGSWWLSHIGLCGIGVNRGAGSTRRREHECISRFLTDSGRFCRRLVASMSISERSGPLVSTLRLESDWLVPAHGAYLLPTVNYQRQSTKRSGSV